MTEAKLESFEPVIVAFCCHYCAFAAADLAGTLRLKYPPNVRIIRLPCTGKLDALYLLKALEAGADGVIVAGCLEGSCHFISGNKRAKKRVEGVKALLGKTGIEQERLEFFNLSSAQGDRFAQIAREMTQRISGLGPLRASTEARLHLACGTPLRIGEGPGERSEAIPTGGSGSP